MTLPDHIIHTIREGLELGGAEILRRHEIIKGYKLIDMASPPNWYIPDDWQGESIISRDKRRIRIVGIMARVYGHGAFRRLVTGIIMNELMPVVVQAMPEMERILLHWNWRKQTIGSSYTREERWFPQRKFIDDILLKEATLFT